MSTVTRSTFLLHVSNYPYIDLEVKGLLTFMTAYESLEYITPTGEDRIWPRGPEAAKEDGISLTVKPWEFWLLIDGGRGEISCSNHSCHGFRYQVYNASQDTYTSMEVTEQEAIDIKKAVDAMIGEHDHMFNRLFKPGQSGLYRPAHKVTAYPVKSRRYDHVPEDTLPRREYGPKWPATQADIDQYRD